MRKDVLEDRQHGDAHHHGNGADCADFYVSGADHADGAGVQVCRCACRQSGQDHGNANEDLT